MPPLPASGKNGSPTPGAPTAPDGPPGRDASGDAAATGAAVPETAGPPGSAGSGGAAATGAAAPTTSAATTTAHAAYAEDRMGIPCDSLQRVAHGSAPLVRFRQRISITDLVICERA